MVRIALSLSLSFSSPRADSRGLEEAWEGVPERSAARLGSEFVNFYFGCKSSRVAPGKCLEQSAIQLAIPKFTRIILCNDGAGPLTFEGMQTTKTQNGRRSGFGEVCREDSEGFGRVLGTSFRRPLPPPNLPGNLGVCIHKLCFLLLT